MMAQIFQRTLLNKEVKPFQSVGKGEAVKPAM